MRTTIYSLSQAASRFFGPGASDPQVQPVVDYVEVLKAVAHEVANDVGKKLCDDKAYSIVREPVAGLCGGYSPYVVAELAPEYFETAKHAVAKLVHDHFGLAFEAATPVYATPKNNSY